MSVVDTRLLGRPSTFGGAEAEWPDWAFSMRAYGAAIDAAFPGAMEVASRATAPVLVTTHGVPEQNVARQLFFMLAMMTKGPALAIVRQAEISGGGPNGLEAWRLLVRRYEPEASTRTLGLLQQILNPVPFPDNVTGFEEALSKWELTISRWESSAHDALNEDVKIALLLKMTPEPLRQNLHLQGHTKYGVARAAVVNALLSQHSWQNTPEPMEVGERLVAKGLTRVRPKARGNRNTSHSRNSKTKTTAITSATIAVRWVTFRHSVGASSVRARAKAKTRQCQPFRHQHQPAVPLMWAVLELAVPQDQ